MPIKLELIFQPKGKYVYNRFFEFDKDNVKIGRCPKRDVYIPDVLVSPKHGEFNIYENGAKYIDYSIAGTDIYCNGKMKRIIGGEIPVNQGDILKFNMYKLKVARLK